ncbi:TraR/DksA family transcriptional regulator [Streptomyces longwoodensis]|uniref:Molecular chaperone DnaK n=1 Tax=Streptomyces longwoodensis TaxID=68231 RepID=A0A101R3F7_9ACTN|nr:TraR/DksA C4-type zinc finger protein [Streptomyces longwoodensis]KUN40965.1 molecular chaperone DnaK [Streptomyces longwoodensis]
MTLDATRAEPHPHHARQRLEHARTARLAQLRALDEAEPNADDHLLTAQRTAMEQVLQEIDLAFARIDDGTYGTCAGCARPIPAERLEILPYTRHCVACRRLAA